MLTDELFRLVILCLFVVLGAFASLLLNVNEAVTKPNYSRKQFLKQNWLPTLTNVIVGCIICAATYNESNMFVMTKLLAFALGAIAQQFFKKICNIFLSDKHTFIGINRRHDDEEDEDITEP